MNIDDHIAAIKEHLKAIEAEKHPKKEPSLYLALPLIKDMPTPDDIADYIESMAEHWSCKNRTSLKAEYPKAIKTFFRMVGKIITVNEE